ncbi:MAG: flagellar hook-basal body complex protein FliE [Peptococcaceae bacterium]|nr:flagellar hook-basal body complex protein FliE [Candidatus Syntrophopropionicum ammoniitolerans]
MQVLPIELLPPQLLQPANAGVKQEDGVNSFAMILDDALKQLNNTQIKADQLTVDLLTGQTEDVHQVIIAMTEAKLAMQLAVEVRNKMVEAYQEVSRMQV